MRFNTLTAWLEWQTGLHPHAIDLGLARVAEVYARLRLPAWNIPVITVAGTNGKGSCQAYLEALLTAAGYRVGCYSSPHLLRYQERIRCAGEEISATALCEAFAQVDTARGGISLTYFEFGTLAALCWLARQQPEALIMEVGLGGRLDAVNLLDADVALITTISHDHEAWLGSDLDSIAREKAGILRPGRPVVIAQPGAPVILDQLALEQNARPWRCARDYRFLRHESDWEWQGQGHHWTHLPTPALIGDFQWQNAAAALMVLELLADRLPVAGAAIHQGLRQVRLPGRFQRLLGAPGMILDVAHNAEAASALANNLLAHPCSGRRHAVFSLLRDKHLETIAPPLLPLFHSWHLGQIDDPRAWDVAALATELRHLGGASVMTYPSIEAACAGARASAGAQDELVAFGSFGVVAPVLAQWSGQNATI